MFSALFNPYFTLMLLMDRLQLKTVNKSSQCIPYRKQSRIRTELNDIECNEMETDWPQNRVIPNKLNVEVLVQWNEINLIIWTMKLATLHWTPSIRIHKLFARTEYQKVILKISNQFERISSDLIILKIIEIDTNRQIGIILKSY